MSGASIQTKFTLGLLSVDPNDPANQIPWEEETSEEVLAINQAARDAIKAKKRAKKVARQKSKESQSSSRRKKVTRQKSKEPAPTTSPDMEAKKKQEEEEAAARKRAEEEEARKAEEDRLRREKEEEEAAKRAAEEEERLRKEVEAAKRAAEEEEAARKLAEEEAAKRVAEEEAARLAAEVVEEPEPSMTEEEDEPEPPKERPKLERRISFFPASGDNTGLNDAIQRYGNDVPFEWEKEEWTREHVNLKHTSTLDRTYGWELPDWAKNNNLRKTELGEKVKKGACLRRDVQFGGVHRRGTPRRSISMAPDRGPIEITSKEIISATPDWAKGNILRTTEMGAAARQGLNLAVPVHILKGLAEGSIGDLEFEASFADLGVAVVAGGQKNIAQDKPEWSVNPTLKSSDIGLAVRQGANLALPVVEREGHLNESKEMSPNSSFAALNASLRSVTKEKPAWAKMALKKTAKGEQMKETGSLARGPTIKVVDK